MGFFSRVVSGIKSVFKSVSNIASVASETIEASVPESVYSAASEIDNEIEYGEYKEKSELDSLKDSAKPLIDMANSRLEALRAENLHSPALSRFYEEHGSYSEDTLFNIDNLYSLEEINAELTKAHVFLNDETSTVHGARVWQTQVAIDNFTVSQLNLAQFMDNTLTEDYAKVAYSIFRDIESLEAFKTQMFDSDRVFNYIYSMVEQKMLTPSETDEFFDEKDDIRAKTLRMIDEAVGAKHHEFVRSFENEAARAETLYRKAKVSSEEGDYFGSKEYF